MSRSYYRNWDSLEVGDEYVYCDDDFQLFQDMVDSLEKKTTKDINNLLKKHGFDQLKVEFFDIDDTEMDEDGFDIHAVIHLQGRSKSKLEHIEFILTGDVSVEQESYDYMGTVQPWMESPPYEEASVEVICPKKPTEFTISRRESKLSIKNFLDAIESFLINYSKTKRGNLMNSRYAKDQFIEEGREETICDPMDPMNCTGVLRFKNGKPIPAYVMLRGFLIGVAVAQNDEDVIEKYGEDVLSKLELAIRGWLRKASGNAEYTLSDGQKRWLNKTLGGKSGVLSPILRRYVVTECSKSGGCDLPDPARFRFAGMSLTVVPAYGRDYKSKKEVEAAWNADKDFIVQDMMSRWDGSSVNKSDAKSMGIKSVTIRYKQLRNVTVIKVATQDKTAVEDEIYYIREELSEIDGILAYLNNIRFHLFDNEDTEEGLEIALGSTRQEYSRMEPNFKKIERAIRKGDYDKAEDIIVSTKRTYEKREDGLKRELSKLQKRKYKQQPLSRLARNKTASRYSLPAKRGGEIVFGIDRAMGWFFQLWLDEDEPSMDKDFLSNGALIDLLEKYGKPSRELDKSIAAIAMDREPADNGVRGFRASRTISRKKKSNGCGCRSKKTANKPPQSLEEIEIGSVWVSTYSYSSIIQTFYEVVAKTPKSVKIRELEKVYVGERHNSMTWDVTAKAGNYKQGSRPMLAKVRESGRGVVLTAGGKYGVFAHSWNGRPMQEMST